VFSSASAEAETGLRVYLKAELFQRTGSFKPRGVLNKLATLGPEQRAHGVIAASSGNHAQALAYCAREQGLDCLVVMPRGSSEQKVAATRGYGATVDRHCDDGMQALEHAERLALASGRTLVPAYDDDAVIAGQGTIGLELLEQIPELDAVIVPVSGGGLAAGVALALKSVRPEIEVVAVEPELAPTLERALDAGRPVQVHPRTMADGLAAPVIGERCLGLCEHHVDEVVHVSDLEIVQAMRWLYANAKLAGEPAGAAALAAVLSRRTGLPPRSRVAAIISGGNVELETAARLLVG
jgi:threonine dehydratase